MLELTVADGEAAGLLYGRRKEVDCGAATQQGEQHTEEVEEVIVFLRDQLPMASIGSASRLPN